MALFALLTVSLSASADTYVKVTSADDLVVGENYIIVESSSSTTYILAGAISSGKFTAITTGFTISDDKSTIITSTATPNEYKLGSSSKYYTLKNGNNFLGYSSKTNLRFNQTNSNTNNEKWTISSNSTYGYVIVNAATTDRGIGRNDDKIGAYQITNYAEFKPCVIYKKQVSITVTGVSISPTKATMTVGDKQTLTATVYPDNATNKTVTWSTSAPGVATVATVDSNTSEVTAEAPGTATIKATTEDGSYTASCTVTVNPAAPTLTVASGEVINGTNVKVSNYNDEYLYFYTTDGTNPACGEKLDATGTSIEYNHETGITITEDVTLKIIAVALDEDLNLYTSDVTTATYTVPTNPIAQLSTTSLAFGDVKVGTTSSLTFTVTPANLTGALTISCDNAKYTVSPTSIAQDTSEAQTITVTAKPTAYNDNLSGTITISGGGVDPNPTVTLTGTAYVLNTVTIASASNGSISAEVDGEKISDGDEVMNGKTVTITATPNSNYQLSALSIFDEDDNEVSVSNNTFTMPAKAVTISATFKGIPVSNVELDDTSITLTVGAKHQLTATVSPADALDRNVTWTSSNTAIATVTDEGLVEAIALGTATITATAGNQTATCVISVGIEASLNKTNFGVSTGNNAEEQTYTLNDITITAGCTSSATSKTYYDNSHVRFYADSYLVINAPGYLIKKIVFSADDTWKGNINVDEGTYDNDTKTWTGSVSSVTFNFAAQNRIASALITIEPIPVTAISLNKTSATLSKGGDTETISVSSVTPQDASPNVSWTSSDESIATVSSSGIVSPVACGTATITATSSITPSVTATCSITVIPAAPVLSVDAGDVISGTVVKVSNYDSSSAYYYTNDGETTPTSFSTVYKDKEGISITSSVTLKIIAINNNQTSAVTSATYTISEVPVAMLSAEELAFGDIEINKTKQLTFTITPANLTEALTLTSDNDKYTVSPTTIAAGTTTAQTITVTAAPIAVNDNMAGTISITGGGTPTLNEEITLSATPLKYYTVTFNSNGSVISTKSDYRNGDEVIFPSNPDKVSGKIFIGWRTSELDAVTDTNPDDYVSSAIIDGENQTYYAVFATLIPGNEKEVVDKLDHNLIGVKETNYNIWDNLRATSDAIYAGNSAGGNSSIQLRSNNNNSGIVTTESGGKIKKVVVTWNSNTTSGRTLDIYGSNTAFDAATDLYSQGTQGTKIGNITYGTSTEWKVSDDYESDDYEYIGLRSNSGAMYITSIAITWLVGEPDIYSGYCTTVPMGEKDPVSGKYYATYSNTQAFVVPDDVTVAQVVEKNGLIYLERYAAGDVVAANTGVLLESENIITTAFELTNKEATNLGVINVLRASGAGITADKMGETDDPANNYFYRLTKGRLPNGEIVFGFYWKVEGGAAFDLGANKAYMVLPNVQSAPRYVWLDGQTTAIDGLNADTEATVGSDERIYSLDGRRVEGQLKRGIYVKNGKKFIVR